MTRSRFQLLCVALLAASTARATVTLPAVLADHMVLQRNAPIHIWGFAQPGEQVSVELNGSIKASTADATGAWSVDLPQMKEGGPYEVHVRGTNTITLKDVLIGDLWLAGGQSNMGQNLDEWSRKSPGDHVFDDANHPDIRLYVSERVSALTPQSNNHPDLPWTRCSASTMGKFSAAAYYFARKIAEAEHVPVGIIDVAWGGTVAEAWVSPAGLQADPALTSLATAAYAHRHEDVNPNEKRSAQDGRHRPTGDFNGMIAPLTPMRIRGLIWYQGADNTNAFEIPVYPRAAPAVFMSWRQAFHQDFPVIIGQQSLSSPQVGVTANWPVVREVQRVMTRTVPNSAMIVTIDLNKDASDVHDISKPAMGGRYAMAARALAYHEPVEYSGPLFDRAVADGDGMRVTFTHNKSGLVVKNGDLAGFELAGKDKAFVPADARIDGSSVVVTSDKVKNPMYVRYAWAGVPKATLYNHDDLPASPFSSEN